VQTLKAQIKSYKRRLKVRYYYCFDKHEWEASATLSRRARILTCVIK
jgi:hypothetical protein